MDERKEKNLDNQIKLHFLSGIIWIFFILRG